MRPSILYFDLEVFPNLFQFGVKSEKDGIYKTFFVYHLSDGTIANELESIYQFIESSKSFVFCGFNNVMYDDQVIGFLLKHEDRLKSFTTKRFCRTIYKLSGKIIGKAKRRRTYPRYTSMDLQKILQAGTRRKSLKMLAVNLKWKLIMDSVYEFSDPIEGSDDIVEIIKYNANDIDITERLAQELKDAIDMRFEVGKRYGVNLLSSSDSMMSGKILDKRYAEVTKQSKEDFIDLRSERGWMYLKDIISDKINFKTTNMQNFLTNLKTEVTSAADNDPLDFQVRIGDTSYDFGKGGLHSVHIPEIIIASKGEQLLEIDAAAFYPNIILGLGIRPEHLLPEFLDLYKDIVDGRQTCKDNAKEARQEAKKAIDTPDVAEQWIAKAIREDQYAGGEKVMNNGVFGKFNYNGYWLYDPLALYKVTINGQLFLLMLIERLESSGIPVFYANTDGITVKILNSQRSTFEKVCKKWEKYTGFSLEEEEMVKYVIRDVNHYLAIKKDGSVKGKGHLDKDSLKNPTISMGLMKGYKYPIIPLAIHEYFVNGTSVEDTIMNHKDVLDFCSAQKVGDKFHAVRFDYIKDFKRKTIPVQKVNRYLVCNPRYGGFIYKVKWKEFEVTKIDEKTQTSITTVELREHKTSLVSKQHVILINDLNKFNRRFKDKNVIYYPYYIKEAKRVIQLFKYKQLSFL